MRHHHEYMRNDIIRVPEDFFNNPIRVAFVSSLCSSLLLWLLLYYDNYSTLA